MAINDFDSSSSRETDAVRGALPTWLKVGAVAAASALVGGLAAAWVYRGTLQKLQDSDLDDQNPNFRREDEVEHDGV